MFIANYNVNLNLSRGSKLLSSPLTCAPANIMAALGSSNSKKKSMNQPLQNS